ncbi:hypothetical protein SGLAM104S_08946 [Streptomyces glaucescens]
MEPQGKTRPDYPTGVPRNNRSALRGGCRSYAGVMTEQAIYRRPRETRDRLTPPPGFTYPEITDGEKDMFRS